MKAIVVTDQAAGMAGVKLVERPEPQAAINDVVVQIHASGFTGDELTWPSTWTDRVGRDRTPSIPGHELAGVVTALGYGTTGLSIGQRVFGLTDWYRDGTLAEYLAVEGRNPTAVASGCMTIDFVVVPDRAQLSELVQRLRVGRLRTNIGNAVALDDAVAAFNRTERIKGKTIIRVHPEDSGLPNAHEGAIHAPNESLDVECDYADRFLSHS